MYTQEQWAKVIKGRQIQSMIYWTILIYAYMNVVLAAIEPMLLKDFASNGLIDNQT